MSESEELNHILDVVRYLISRPDTIGTDCDTTPLRYTAWAKAGPSET